MKSIKTHKHPPHCSFIEYTINMTALVCLLVTFLFSDRHDANTNTRTCIFVVDAVNMTVVVCFPAFIVNWHDPHNPIT